MNRHSPTAIMICPPTAAELGFSARTGTDHTRIVQQLTAFPECVDAPRGADVLAIQNQLWSNGRLRSIDTLIAAYALHNTATVLHYDRDFEHVAAVMPEFSHQWIVAPGSVD